MTASFNRSRHFLRKRTCNFFPGVRTEVAPGCGLLSMLHMGDVLAGRHSSIRNTCFRAPRGIDIAGGIRPGLGTWVPQMVFFVKGPSRSERRITLLL